MMHTPPLETQSASYAVNANPVSHAFIPIFCVMHRVSQLVPCPLRVLKIVILTLKPLRCASINASKCTMILSNSTSSTESDTWRSSLWS